MYIDFPKIRQEFPILSTKVGQKPLVYLDNAATTQKPRAVIDALETYYTNTNANIHRGVHYLAEKATAAYEESRGIVAKFLNASQDEEIVFVRGTTEGINLVASSFGNKYINEGDEIIISAMEHHANIVPWQLLCEKKGAHLKIIPVDENGVLEIDAFEELLSDKTKIVTVVHASNALGTINPIKSIIDKSHAVGARVLIDGAQAVGHFPVNVQQLDCDFYVFSSHKLYGPTGIGALYGKYDLLESMPPYQGGGDMINEVTFEKTTFKEPPERFEAGTPNIAGVMGMARAIEYLENLNRAVLLQHEEDLLHHATARLNEVEGIRIYGTSKDKVSLVAFTLAGSHPHDMATVLDADGIAIRAGHHCTQPLHSRYGIAATARASFAFYNTYEEIDILTQSLKKIQLLFA